MSCRSIQSDTGQPGQISGEWSDSFQFTFAETKLQARPNAFELYAVDFLVSHRDSIRVKLVGIDAEPTFRFIGTQLNWVLDEVFAGIAQIAVEPFFAESEASKDRSWGIGEERHSFLKFVDEERIKDGR